MEKNYVFTQTPEEIQGILNRVPTVEQQVEGLQQNVGTLNETVGNLGESVTQLQETKVEKVEGKQLSTEDFTTEEKAKLDALPTNAELQEEYASQQEVGGIDERLEVVEQLGQISVQGGSIGIATPSDFDDPTPEQAAKVPTVGAILGCMDEEPTAGSALPVQSGGVKNAISDGLINTTDWMAAPLIAGGHFQVTNGYTANATVGYTLYYIQCKKGDALYLNILSTSSTNQNFRVYLTNTIPNAAGIECSLVELVNASTKKELLVLAPSDGYLCFVISTYHELKAMIKMPNSSELSKLQNLSESFTVTINKGIVADPTASSFGTEATIENNNFGASDFIDVTDAKYIAIPINFTSATTVTGRSGSYKVCGSVFYDENKQPIQVASNSIFTSQNSAYPLLYTAVPSNAKYIRITCYNGENVKWTYKFYQSLQDEKDRQAYDLIGKGDTAVSTGGIYNIKAGNTYRVWVKNPNISMEGISYSTAGYVRFKVYIRAADSTNIIEVGVGMDTASTPLPDYYDIAIPIPRDGELIPEFMYIAMRAKEGEKQVVMIEDITYASNLREELSVPQPVTISNGSNSFIGFSDDPLRAGKWYATAIKSWLMPVVPGEVYEVTAINEVTEGNRGRAGIAFLTSNQKGASNATPAWATGYNKVVEVEQGTSKRFTTPQDAVVMYVYMANGIGTSNSRGAAPQSIVKLEKLKNEVEKIVEQIGNLSPEIVDNKIRMGVGGGIFDEHPQVEVSGKIRDLCFKGSTMQTNAANVWGNFVFAHITDCHGSDSDVDSVDTYGRFLEYCSYYKEAYELYVRDIVSTGDLIEDHLIDKRTDEDNTTPVTREWSKIDGGEKVIQVIGNHDVASRYSSGYQWMENVGRTAYDYFIKDAVESWSVNQPDNAEGNGYCYFSKDYIQQNVYGNTFKLKALFVDYMDWQNAQVDDRHNSLSYHQASWVKSQLDSALENGQTVVVFVHDFPGSLKAYDTPFNSSPYSISELQKYGGSYSNDYYYLAELIHNFQVDPRGGNFACYVTGHRHAGNIGQITGIVESFDTPSTNIDYDDARYPQLVVCGRYGDVRLSMGSAAGNQSWILRQTENQDCFRFISIDTTNKLVKVLQIGRNRTHTLKEQDLLCLSYAAINNFTPTMTLSDNPMSVKVRKGNSLWRLVNVIYKDENGTQVIDWNASDKVLASRVINM